MLDSSHRRAGNWEVTLVDLSALLLCFFVVFVATTRPRSSVQIVADPSTTEAVASSRSRPALATPSSPDRAGPDAFAAAIVRARLQQTPGLEVSATAGSVRILPKGRRVVEVEELRPLLTRLRGLYRGAIVVLSLPPSEPLSAALARLAALNQALAPVAAVAHAVFASGAPGVAEIRLDAP